MPDAWWYQVTPPVWDWAGAVAGGGGGSGLAVVVVVATGFGLGLAVVVVVGRGAAVVVVVVAGGGLVVVVVVGSAVEPSAVPAVGEQLGQQQCRQHQVDGEPDAPAHRGFPRQVSALRIGPPRR
jgi:hypothetical protein